MERVGVNSTEWCERKGTERYLEFRKCLIWTSFRFGCILDGVVPSGRLPALPILPPPNRPLKFVFERRIRKLPEKSRANPVFLHMPLISPHLAKSCSLELLRANINPSTPTKGRGAPFRDIIY